MIMGCRIVSVPRVASDRPLHPWERRQHFYGGMREPVGLHYAGLFVPQAPSRVFSTVAALALYRCELDQEVLA